MAEPTDQTERTEVGRPPGGPTTPTHRARGTTWLSRVSGVLAWLVGAWFCFYGYPGGYLPLLVAGIAMIWLGIGAWRGRRRRTIGLAVLSLAAAVWYPAAAWWRWTHTDELRDISYPGLWAAMLGVQSAVLLAVAVTAAVSLRRPAGDAAATTDATPTTDA
jgi:hypothetical protein